MKIGTPINVKKILIEKMSGSGLPGNVKIPSPTKNNSK
jgi:hypothetical protein